MKVYSRKLYAILTGDVVGSSKLTPDERRELPGLLRQAARQLRKAFAEAVPLDIDIFRGDSWQLFVADPAQSLRVGLFFRAVVIASAPTELRRDTRIAIAIGGIDFIPTGRVSEGNGEAYQLSGEALDTLREPERMTFVRKGPDEANHTVIVRLLDALVQEWTAPQARAVLGRLQGWTQVQIATLWPSPIAQQAVGRHLERAHWPAIETCLRRVEEDLRRL